MVSVIQESSCVPMHVTRWVLTITVAHSLFAKEDTNSGGLRRNKKQAELGFYLEMFNSSARAFERRDKKCLGCLLKGHAAFLTGENYALSSLLWEHWHRRETFAPPDSPWAASVLIFQGHWLTLKTLSGEAKVPHSFRDHKTLFNKIPQAQVPKKVCNKFTIKTISLAPSETIMLQTKATWYSDKYFSYEVIRVFFSLIH